MKAAQIAVDITSAGGTLWVEDGHLKAKSISAHLIPVIRENKTALLALLSPDVYAMAEREAIQAEGMNNHHSSRDRNRSLLADVWRLPTDYHRRSNAVMGQPIQCLPGRVLNMQGRNHGPAYPRIAQPVPRYSDQPYSWMVSCRCHWHQPRLYGKYPFRPSRHSQHRRHDPASTEDSTMATVTRNITIKGNPVSPEQDAAKTAAMPEVQAALTIEKYGWGGFKTDAQYTIPELAEQTKRVNDGDLSRIEDMLTSQMHTLDAMFNSLARRAMDTTIVDQTKLWLTASLKAQRQCVQAAEALATLKNPAVFVGKQQIHQSAGPMQVNNAPVPVKSDHDSELMEITHEHIERLDTGAPGKTGRDDPAMEAVGAEHRASHYRRKGQKRG